MDASALNTKPPDGDGAADVANAPDVMDDEVDDDCTAPNEKPADGIAGHDMGDANDDDDDDGIDDEGCTPNTKGDGDGDSDDTRPVALDCTIDGDVALTVSGDTA